MNQISLFIIPLFVLYALIIGFIYNAITKNKDEHALDIGIDIMQYIVTAAILFFMAYNMLSND